MAKCKSDKSWERQPKEGIQAFEAFCKYLELGEERSINRVAQELHKSHALIGRWSATWDWQERVREYEADQRLNELKAAQKKAKKMRERQIQESMILQKKAMEALDRLDVSKLSAKDILGYLTEGAKMERELTQLEQNAAPSVGSDNSQSSLADVITAAYAKRRGEE